MSTEKPILYNTDMVQAILEDRKWKTRRAITHPLIFSEMHTDAECKKHGHQFGFLSADQNKDAICCLRCGWGVEPASGNMPIRPKYSDGDILWVRETWRIRNVYGDFANDNRVAEIEFRAGGKTNYMAVAGDIIDGRRWRPSIHMPKEAARLFLKVTNVQVERLQASFFEPISPILALREEGIDIGNTCRECIESYGFPCCVETVDEDGSNLYGGECGMLDAARSQFAELWDSTVPKKDLARRGWTVNPWVWVYSFDRIPKPQE